LTIPSAAIATGQDGTFVYVVGTDMKATTQKVTAGRVVGDRVVIENGLTAGQTVVIDGQSRVTPGAKVEITTTKPGAAPKAGAPGGDGAPGGAKPDSGRSGS
jgi:multidrug efflux system membrane fusion protein